jgi:acyl carrier protein
LKPSNLLLARWSSRHNHAEDKNPGDFESMTLSEIRNEILDILEDISPDEDLDSLDDDKPFRDQLEMDSMDFLDIVMELRKRHRIQIPEEEYGNLASMSSTVSYLEPRMKDIVKA